MRIRYGDSAPEWRLGALFALAAGLLIPIAPAGAQTPAATACTTAACTSAQQSQLVSVLSPFTTLAGTNTFSVNFQTETGIYQNATYTKQVQAAANATLPAVLTLIWQPNNNPSSLDANVLAALSNSTVMSAVTNAFDVPNTASQATFLKSYGGFTSYQSYGQIGFFPTNIDPHPFQTNAVISANQWTNATAPCPPGTPASSCPAAVQSSNWSSDSSNSTSGSFPSAHMIGGSLAALTYAVMMPEVYQDLMLS